MDIRHYHMGKIDRHNLTEEQILKFIEAYENNALRSELSLSIGENHIKPEWCGRVVPIDYFGSGACSLCGDICRFDYVKEDVDREEELAKYQAEHPYQAYFGTVIGEQIEAYLRLKHEKERLQNYLNKISNE